jgi:hypothetical protein
VEQFDIEAVNSPEELLTVKILLEEYWNSLGFNHQTFGFGDELDSLPGAFARPQGRYSILCRTNLQRTTPKHLH